MAFERQKLGTQRARQRRFLRPIVAAVIVVVILFGWYRHALSPVDAQSDARVNVTIPSGSALPAISSELWHSGVIRSPQAFNLHVRLARRDHLIRAGTYVLQPSMSAGEILDVLTGGAEGEVSVTIPEGFTVADIDRLMAHKGFTATGAIIECAQHCDFSEFEFLPNDDEGPGGRIEGYLFPDTYFLGGEGSDPKAFLSRLLSTFRDRVVTPLSGDVAASGKPLFDVVTMASLIEKEAAGDDERATIAGILWKRFDAGMILGVDASVRYAVNKEPREPLTKADLESDSPYNLRIRKGLPPGPIANPGLASIKAALHPETTPYFYYLHDKEGNIHYAVTNEEHNQNRARYLP